MSLSSVGRLVAASIIQSALSLGSHHRKGGGRFAAVGKVMPLRHPKAMFLH